METKLIHIVIALSISIISSGQFYEIKEVNPNTVIPGQINNFSVKLNRILDEGDSILNAYLLVHDKNWTNDTLIYNSTLETIDTSVYISFDFPDKDFALEGALYLNMKITDYHDSIGIWGIKIGKEISFIQPDICIVRVDSSDKNIIMWEFSSNNLLDSVNIYRETFVLNEYELIGKRAIEDISIFKDETSIPAQNSNRYMISFIDTLGAESPTSYPHKTIHLSINQAFGGTINLSWNNYEGFYFSTYSIYRGFSKDNMIKIADIASNLYTFSDIAPPIGNLYYQVQVMKTNPCIIINGLEPVDEMLNSSKSNIQSFKITNITDQKENQVILYPNPIENDLYIKMGNEVLSCNVIIYDLTGQIVSKSVELSSNSVLSLIDLPKGMFIVRINYSGIVINKIIVKAK